MRIKMNKKKSNQLKQWSIMSRQRPRKKPLRSRLLLQKAPNQTPKLLPKPRFRQQSNQMRNRKSLQLQLKRLKIRTTLTPTKSIRI